jgi:GTPase
MILCYVVTFSMVGFAFNLVGMSFGWNVRNQGRLLGLITMPVQLVTSYICFRFLARELAAKAVDRALNEKQNQLVAKNAVRPITEGKSAEVAPLRTGGGNAG